MQRTETRFEGAVTAICEDGREITLHLYVTYTIFEPLDGPREEKRGSYLLELEDGSSAQILDEDTVRVDGTGEVLRVLWEGTRS